MAVAMLGDVNEPGPGLSRVESKLRSGKWDQTERQRRERTLVRAASATGSSRRTTWRRSSGSSLTRSQRWLPLVLAPPEASARIAIVSPSMLSITQARRVEGVYRSEYWNPASDRADFVLSCVSEPNMECMPSISVFRSGQDDMEQQERKRRRKSNRRRSKRTPDPPLRFSSSLARRCSPTSSDGAKNPAATGAGELAKASHGGDAVAGAILTSGPPQHRGQEVCYHCRDAHAAGTRIHARRHVQREAHAPAPPHHGDGFRGQGREAFPAYPQLAEGRRHPRAVGIRVPATPARGGVLSGLADYINEKLGWKRAENSSEAELTRKDVIKCIQAQKVRFRGVNLSGLDLSKLDLSEVDFSYACIKNTNFSCANLHKARFRLVEATCSSFQRANLHECELIGANLQDSVLDKANLQSANLQDACLTRSSFIETDLRSAHLQSANLMDANLNGANLEGANLKGAKLAGTNLQGANLQRAYLREVDLRETHLTGAKLGGANLLGAIR